MTKLFELGKNEDFEYNECMGFLPNKSKSRRSMRRGFKFKLKKNTVFSIGVIFFFLLAALVTLSFLRQGTVLIKLNSYLIQVFGWGTIFLPFILIMMGLMLTRVKTAFNEPHVIVGVVLFLLSCMGISKSGIVGYEIWNELSSMVTPYGTFILLVGGLVIGLIVFFNTSIDQVFIIILKIINESKKYIFAIKKPLPKMVTEQKPLFKNASEPALSTREPSKSPLTKTSEPFAITPVVNSSVPPSGKIWQYPPISLLSESMGGKAERGDTKSNADIIEKTLDSFGITARVKEINPGPAVTQYALEVAQGTKLSKITGLSNDLALALAAPHGLIRIEAPIPGRALVGIELPNHTAEFVTLRKMLDSDVMKNSKSKLTVALGLDVSGHAVIADLARMPHVLIAGSTGSGKTVCLNTFVASLLFKTTPEEVRLILVDPKRVELTQYNGVPHLLSPVIVEPEKVISALKWATVEMDRRYKLFAQVGARNIDNYNELSGFFAIPYIVIIIDELADIMLFSPVEVEDTICRIAQMARATGIHLVVSTQRPSVDVLTGLIKANIPCRISFAVSSMIDSRVIIDQPGAEKLLGRGDMLYVPPDQAKPTRIQGAYVSDKDIQNLIDFLKAQGAPVYTEEVMTTPVGHISGRGNAGGGAGGDGNRDELFEEALRTVCQYDRASASLLQRRMSVGYARAARILDQLEAAGVVSPSEGSKSREVLVRNPEEFLSPPTTAPQE